VWELEIVLFPVRCLSATAPELTFSPLCGSPNPKKGLGSVRGVFPDMCSQSKFLEVLLLTFLVYDREIVLM
jgi:hypothetical protein